METSQVGSTYQNNLRNVEIFDVWDQLQYIMGKTRNLWTKKATTQNKKAIMLGLSCEADQNFTEKIIKRLNCWAQPM